MQDDTVCPREGQEPYTPTDEEILHATEQFEVLDDSRYDDDYIEMHSTYYRNHMRVFKWFKEQYEIYKECLIRAWRKETILLERIKWLEIEKIELEEQEEILMKQEIIEKAITAMAKAVDDLEAKNEKILALSIEVEKLKFEVKELNEYIKSQEY